MISAKNSWKIFIFGAIFIPSLLVFLVYLTDVQFFGMLGTWVFFGASIGVFKDERKRFELSKVQFGLFSGRGVIFILTVATYLFLPMIISISWLNGGIGVSSNSPLFLVSKFAPIFPGIAGLISWWLVPILCFRSKFPDSTSGKFIPAFMCLWAGFLHFGLILMILSGFN